MFIGFCLLLTLSLGTSILNEEAYIGSSNEKNSNQQIEPNHNLNTYSGYVENLYARAATSTKERNKNVILLNTEVKHITRESRSKRNVFNLYNMIGCSTGCDPLSYKGYGCYCGFLGSGYPVDGIDRCCKQHDLCYTYSKCAPLFEYIVPYNWNCNNEPDSCANNQAYFFGDCARRLCECDKSLGQCLRRFPCPTKKPGCQSSSLRYFQNTYY